jgi:hypothetical protein
MKAITMKRHGGCDVLTFEEWIYQSWDLEKC